MKQSKRRWIIVGTVIVAVVLGASMLVTRVLVDAEDNTTAPNATMTLERGDIKNTVSGTGYLSAEASVDLKSSTSGTVEDILVTEGEAVSEGKLLVQMENDEETLALLEATNRLEDARLALKSAQASRLPATEIARLERELALQELEVQLKQTALADTVIKAPFTGVVSEIYVEEGELAAGDTVNASEPILRLIDVGTLYAKVNVDEVDIARVETGQAVEISVDAYSDLVFPGRVMTIAAEATNESGIVVIEVLVRLDKPDSRLKPGFTATADIVVEQAEGVLLLPVEEVQQRGDEYFVIVMRNGSPTPQPVEVGITDGTDIEIRSGLAEGDTVVSVGLQALIAARERAEGSNSAKAGPRRMMRM
jgi:RND family efflux transporter MFP subunit